MSKINEVEELIKAGKSCKEVTGLGFSESTFYRAKARSTTNDKKPGEQDSKDGEMGDKTEETGGNAVPVVDSASGNNSGDSSDNSEVEAPKPKAKPTKTSPKKKSPAKPKGNTKGMSTEVSNLKVEEKNTSWKKKILIALGGLSLVAIMLHFLRPGRIAEEQETEPVLRAQKIARGVSPKARVLRK